MGRKKSLSEAVYNANGISHRATQKLADGEDTVAPYYEKNLTCFVLFVVKLTRLHRQNLN